MTTIGNFAYSLSEIQAFIQIIKAAEQLSVELQNYAK